MKIDQNLPKPLLIATLLCVGMSLNACQSVKNFYQNKVAKPSAAASTPTHSTATPTTTAKPAITAPTPQTPAIITPPSFAITGKIGVTTTNPDGSKTAGSAFYAWGQTDERFAIDLTGALGLGATAIRYNGKQAVLVSEKTGEIVADNPEELLLKSTGWHAPISHLPFWIMGKNAPSDTPSTPQTPLATAQNGDWQATFDYNKTNLPSRIRMTHKDGHRVVLSINDR